MSRLFPLIAAKKQQSVPTVVRVSRSRQPLSKTKDPHRSIKDEPSNRLSSANENINKHILVNKTKINSQRSLSTSKCLPKTNTVNFQPDNEEKKDQSNGNPYLPDVNDVKIASLSYEENVPKRNQSTDRYGVTETGLHKSENEMERNENGSSCRYICVPMCILGSLLLLFGIAAGLVALFTSSTSSSTSTSTVLTGTDVSNTLTTTTTETTTTSLTTATVNMSNLVLLTSTNEVVQGLWNTTAGGLGTLSTPGSGVGHHFPSQTPENALDQNNTTRYTNFGQCNSSLSAYGPIICGTDTGFFLTLRRGSSLLVTIRFLTASSYILRDPMTMTIEGSNSLSSSLTLGNPWTLVYNGSTGLDLITGRSVYGTFQSLQNNAVYYKSYRILITSKRGNSDATQYGEVEMYGY